jgi:hypothetical protein
MIVIPDVSFWQDDPTTPLGIDFAQMKQKTDSVIIRAGQNLWVDNEFVISWKEAKDAETPPGVCFEDAEIIICYWRKP